MKNITNSELKLYIDYICGDIKLNTEFILDYFSLGSIDKAIENIDNIRDSLDKLENKLRGLK